MVVPYLFQTTLRDGCQRKREREKRERGDGGRGWRRGGGVISPTNREHSDSGQITVPYVSSVDQSENFFFIYFQEKYQLRL
jgi:hypothetical protein